MRTKVVLSIVGAVALALGVAQTASAASVTCTVAAGAGLGPAAGVANIDRGVVDADSDISENGKFDFEAFNMNCGAKGTQSVCSLGAFTGASCLMNKHTGTYIVCAGEDSCAVVRANGAVGTSACKRINPLIPVPPVVSGTFKGSCTGSNCTGGKDTATSPALSYSLTFSNKTDVDALTICPLGVAGCPAPSGKNAAGQECSLTTATFGGTITFTEP